MRKIRSYWVIDDAYNANPVSFRSALKTLKQIKTKGRRILVCSDMLELGGKAKKLHEEIGLLAASSGIDLVLSTGILAKNITREAQKTIGVASACHYGSLSALHKKLIKYCRPKDVILVKASRGMKLERTVKFLEENLK